MAAPQLVTKRVMSFRFCLPGSTGCLDPIIHIGEIVTKIQIYIHQHVCTTDLCNALFVKLFWNWIKVDPNAYLHLAPIFSSIISERKIFGDVFPLEILLDPDCEQTTTTWEFLLEPKTPTKTTFILFKFLFATS